MNPKSWLLEQGAAIKAEGHDAGDLQALADRAVHSAVRRRIVQLHPGNLPDQRIATDSACL